MESEKTKLILKDILSKSKSSKEILPTLSEDQLFELKKALEIAAAHLAKDNTALTTVANAWRPAQTATGTASTSSGSTSTAAPKPSTVGGMVSGAMNMLRNLGSPTNDIAGGAVTRAAGKVGKAEADSEIGEQSSSDEDVEKKEVFKTMANGQWKIEPIDKKETNYFGSAQKPWPGEAPVKPETKGKPKAYKPKVDEKGQATEIDYAMLNPRLNRDTSQDSVTTYGPKGIESNKVAKMDTSTCETSTGVILPDERHGEKPAPPIPAKHIDLANGDPSHFYHKHK